MQTNKSILVTRPDHDVVTKYLCSWSKDVIDGAKSKGFVIYDLKSRRSNRAEFESYLHARKPAILFLNGHGNAAIITGYDNEPLVDEHSNLSGSIVYARSCDAGQLLGQRLVEGGLRCFIGYNRKFICGYSPEKSTKPCEDNVARLFLEPSNLVVSTLIKNHPAKEAHTRSKDAMYKNFRRMISSSATHEERYVARWLWSNINSQVLLGDREAKI